MSKQIFYMGDKVMRKDAFDRDDEVIGTIALVDSVGVTVTVRWRDGSSSKISPDYLTNITEPEPVPKWKNIMIDTGTMYWNYPDKETFYGTESSALMDGKRLSKDPETLSFHDTRLTIGEVIEKLREAENLICGIPEDDKYSIGPWGEYSSVSRPFKLDDYWPRGRVFVAPVKGGSEGIYLHIIVDNAEGTKDVVLCKTCCAGTEYWQRCWESAMRISWYLTCW